MIPATPNSPSSLEEQDKKKLLLGAQPPAAGPLASSGTAPSPFTSQSPVMSAALGGAPIAGATHVPGSYHANPMQAPAATQPKAPGLLDTAKSMASGAYHSVVDPIVNKVTEIKDSFGGVEDSIKGLQNTRNQLQTSMVNNPQNVTQDTYNSLATADRQIARATGANLPQGVPATGSIESAPVPQGMPAPVPLTSLPAAPKQFQMPSAEEMAAFRKQTGTAFNAKSINDKLSLERMRGGEETFDSKQANAYRATHKDYRPGMYTKG